MPCSACKNENHTKFECSRLHYVPLCRRVIFRHIHNENQTKQPRQKFKRQKKQISPVLQNKKCKFDQRRYVEEKFDDDHFKEMENLYRFYTDNHESELIKDN